MIHFVKDWSADYPNACDSVDAPAIFLGDHRVACYIFQTGVTARETKRSREPTRRAVSSVVSRDVQRNSQHEENIGFSTFTPRLIVIFFRAALRCSIFAVI